MSNSSCCMTSVRSVCLPRLPKGVELRLVDRTRHIHSLSLSLSTCDELALILLSREKLQPSSLPLVTRRSFQYFFLPYSLRNYEIFCCSSSRFTNLTHDTYYYEKKLKSCRDFAGDFTEIRPKRVCLCWFVRGLRKLLMNHTVTSPNRIF